MENEKVTVVTKELMYFATMDRDIVDNYEISKIAFIKDGIDIVPENFDAIREYAAGCTGIDKEVPHPNVAILYKHHPESAVKLYHDRHPELSFKRCRQIVGSIVKKKKKERKND